jgi:hypothetical protein
MPPKDIEEATSTAIHCPYPCVCILTQHNLLQSIDIGQSALGADDQRLMLAFNDTHVTIVRKCSDQHLSVIAAAWINVLFHLNSDATRSSVAQPDAEFIQSSTLKSHADASTVSITP